MQAISNFFIKNFSKKIGADEFGNQYFQNKEGKRFVLYKGSAEPSKVPFEWHGWLHYTTDIAPVKMDTHKASWQKIHLPNLTGTKNAYSPNNSSVKKTNSTYEFWNPSN
jgi:NADH:ubiquinone oxidoreductase subunit